MPPSDAARLRALEEKFNKLKQSSAKRHKEAKELLVYQHATMLSFVETFFVLGGAIIINKFGSYGVQWLAERVHENCSDFEGDVYYAVLLTIVFPPLSYILSGESTQKETFLGDCLYLLSKALPLLFGWAWLEVLVPAMKLDISNYVPWYEFLVALAITLFVALPDTIKCYRKRMAASATGNEEDSILGRYIITPSMFSIPLGFAWNVVLSWYLVKAVAFVAGNSAAGKKELFGIGVHFVYFIAITLFAMLVSILWKKKKSQSVADPRTAATESSDEEGEFLPASVIRDLAEAQNLTTSKMVSCMSIVFGCAMDSFSSEFFFNYLLRCGSASQCSSSSNFAYGIVITIFMLALLLSLKSTSDESEFGQTFQTFMSFGGGFVVGGAWGQFFKNQIREFLCGSVLCSQLPPLGELVGWYFALAMAYWIFASVFYHFVLNNMRTYRAQHKADFEDTEE